MESSEVCAVEKCLQSRGDLPIFKLLQLRLSMYEFKDRSLLTLFAHDKDHAMLVELDPP